MIAVDFLGATGQALFESCQLSPEQLPETFATQTVMELGDREWSVLAAEPQTRAEAERRGHLRLTLAPFNHNLLFSVPTLAEHLPAQEPGPLHGELILLQEDWRQIEFLPLSAASQVERELAAIRQVQIEERHGSSFRRLHLRALGPLLNISWATLRSHFPQHEEMAGLAFEEVEHLHVVGGFSWRVDGAVLYGLVEADRVSVLGGHPAILRRLGPGLVVDWCQARLERIS